MLSRKLSIEGLLVNIVNNPKYNATLAVYHILNLEKSGTIHFGVLLDRLHHIWSKISIQSIVLHSRGSLMPKF